MELKTYLRILWERWYIVVLVPLIVLVGVVSVGLLVKMKALK